MKSKKQETPVKNRRLDGYEASACLLHRSRDQYNPRLQRVTRGADAVEASMQYLWGCGSRGCISLATHSVMMNIFSLPLPELSGCFWSLWP